MSYLNTLVKTLLGKQRKRTRKKKTEPVAHQDPTYTNLGVVCSGLLHPDLSPEVVAHAFYRFFIGFYYSSFLSTDDVQITINLRHLTSDWAKPVISDAPNGNRKL